MKPATRLSLILSLLVLFLCLDPISRAASTSGKIVPEQFLRRWDPVTFFMSDASDIEPGTIEPNPEEYVEMDPAHPGEFIWIDSRTLQFRPVDAWPPHASFTFRLDGSERILHCLASPPIRTSPAAASENLDPIDSLTLTFPDPVDPARLASMLEIELRPLPGLPGDRFRVLNRQDFELKAMPRADRHDPMTIVVTCHDPIPAGTHATITMQLGDDPSFGRFTVLTFSTAEPFRAIAFGSRTTRLPITLEGSIYSKDQALNCGVGKAVFAIEFSSTLRPVTPIEGRDLVRIAPPVSNMDFTAEGKLLYLNGDFERDVLYHVTLAPSPLTDASGRKLLLDSPSELFFYFPNQPAYIKWTQAQGIVERYGPRQIPIDGRGFDQVDLRIYRVDPLDISYWPFPNDPVEIDENDAPPPAGEEPEPYQFRYSMIHSWELSRQLGNLNVPDVSMLADLPFTASDPAGHAGIDLEPILAETFGPQTPGHYIIGIRTLDTSTRRSFVRIQATDLSLTTIETDETVVFSVTSLSSSQPVPGASIRVERFERDSRTGIAQIEGTTDSEGLFRFRILKQNECGIHRIVVTKDDDVLVLDPNQIPDTYADGNWTPTRQTWLQYICYERGDDPADGSVGHLFTERPVYRPEDTVHIKGYLRNRIDGRLEPMAKDVILKIRSPGDSEWSIPISVKEPGNFYHAFAEPNLPTGLYQVEVIEPVEHVIASTSFRIDAYRIPRFEVSLHGPDRVPLDAPFDIRMTASYYAGGSVAARPVNWRVTQLPYEWKPSRYPGYGFSAHQQFIGRKPPESWPKLDSDGTTDDTGSDLLSINPASDMSAEPRIYAIEATVRDVDDMTVTTARRVFAVPPFAIGLKTGKYFETASDAAAEFIVLGPDEKPVAGKDVTMRLIRRQWHSHLRASDFTDGVARYVTDVVDETVREDRLTSRETARSIDLDIPSAGVYVLELEGTDSLGRAYVVRSDFFVGGDEPVTWSRPVTRVFDLAADQADYVPGDTASIVIQSPFQNASALVVIEGPEENIYSWVPVRDGSGVIQVPIRKQYMPRVPVHCVLMRGRIPGVLPQPDTAMDLGKPATMASTVYLNVKPVEHALDIALKYPPKAKPGETVTIDIALSAAGKPVPGEITLWLVDQAVLSLGKERRLDPIPDMTRPVFSRLSIHDVRDMPFGCIPYTEMPGGGAPEDDSNLFDKMPIRKNFVAVPFYKPDIVAGKDGKAQVTFTLPDNLTVFAVRAKASSRSDRFGFATGTMAVRLPVIVQPSFPRFVRPGDRFNGLAIGRIVEGDAGDGRAQIEVIGANLEGDTNREFEWDKTLPSRIELPLTVASPPCRPDGTFEYDTMTVRVAVSRKSDTAGDAFEVDVPIRDDRRRVTLASFNELSESSPLIIPAIDDAIRAGTLRRTITAGPVDALRMMAGLDFFFGYPYGCAEQRISFGRSMLAVKRVSDLLIHPAYRASADRRIQEVLDYLPNLIDDSGLCAYWHGSSGYVFLTAHAVSFLSEARAAGYPIDTPTLNTFCRALEQSLRSDYSRLIHGTEYVERALALRALSDAGKINSAYAAELSRRAQFLSSEDVAQVILASTGTGQAAPEILPRLIDRMMEGLVFKLNQGVEQFSGQQASALNGLILPSDTRAAGETLRALYRAQPNHAKIPILVRGIIDLGKESGWGSTNANAAALMALADASTHGHISTSETNKIRLVSGNESIAMNLDSKSPVVHYTGTGTAAIELHADRPVGIRHEASYVPGSLGSTVDPAQNGFVVTRELLRLVGPDQPMERLPIDQGGSTLEISAGTVIEDHVRVVNPEERNYVAVTVPLCAGMEPLNPELLTAPPEAKPANTLTREPDHAEYLDDRVSFYFDTLPAGTFDFYFRVKALFAGQYTQPPAFSEMMYREAVSGNSAGATIVVLPREEVKP